MFESQEKYTGTRYTMTVALLLGAFLFSPALLAASQPFGITAMALAFASSCLCIALAWFDWRKYSDLTIPSVVPSMVYTRRAE